MQASQVGGPTTLLNNGVNFPMIGLGTFLATEGDCKANVLEAVLNVGYRNIDTAMIYQNEEAIGEALQEIFASGKVKREELFITTKLWQSDKLNVEGALRESLRKLKLDYIDLYLIHWMAPTMVWEDAEPIKGTPTHKVWAELERLVDAGLIKSIGVSNCTTPMLLDLLTYARIKPVMNQIELHPYFVQPDLVAFHDKLGIKVQAYAPLGSNTWTLKAEHLKSLNLLEEPVIKALSEKYGKKPGQIILNWHLHRGHIIIPKTTNPGRLAENMNCYDFTLTEEEYQSITKLDQ